MKNLAICIFLAIGLLIRLGEVTAQTGLTNDELNNHITTDKKIKLEKEVKELKRDIETKKEQIEKLESKNREGRIVGAEYTDLWGTYNGDLRELEDMLENKEKEFQLLGTSSLPPASQPTTTYSEHSVTEPELQKLSKGGSQTAIDDKQELHKASRKKTSRLQLPPILPPIPPATITPPVIPPPDPIKSSIWKQVAKFLLDYLFLAIIAPIIVSIIVLIFSTWYKRRMDKSKGDKVQRTSSEESIEQKHQDNQSD